MRIGIVGYQGSGKSTVFKWLTGVEPDPAAVHQGQSAVCHVPDSRIEALSQIYQPKKITRAGLELVDTPGLSHSHEGSAGRLALIRESGCLAIVIAAFNGRDYSTDLMSFRDDLLIADLDIVTRRLERLAEQVKKPRPNRDALQAELEILTKLQKILEAGGTTDDADLNADQEKQLKAFQLFAHKPRFVMFNVDDEETDSSRFESAVEKTATARGLPLRLQLELEQMPLDERTAFCDEMGVAVADRGKLIRDLMQASGQMLFFTAGDKEVRSWLIPRGTTALDAAASIHTDLAQGFIRAEVMQCDDLIRLGSERAVKAENLARQEPRDYVIQDGDVILVRHN